jgi:PAS domain S-box-containing protein
VEGQTENTVPARELALLIDSVADYAIFLLDTEGYVRTWNRGAERLKGYRAAEVVGEHFSLFYTPEDRARNHPAHELQVALRDGRYEEEGWRVRKDGTRFWANVVITLVRDESGTIIGFGKVTRDLTPRRLAEDELRGNAAELLAANRELELFRMLVASVRDYAIFLLDPGGHVATWNAGAEHLKGYTAAEITGRHFSVFYTEPDRARDHPANELEIAAREGRYEEEGWRVRKDGTTFWASVTITAVRDESGTLVGFAKVTRDLSERRAAETSLLASNQELDRFASVAAHDLSDPLRTILGFAELLAGQPLPDEAQSFVGHITRTGVRMQRLLASLLDYARAGELPPSPDPVLLAEAADHVVASLAGLVEERGAQVRISVPDGATVSANLADVELILQNLVANALKFGHPEHPVVEIAGEFADGAWRITVADNGAGIAPADRERIFEPFERAHPELSQEGSGLGLAICHRLVHRHGGTLGLESEPGQGSRFWVLLPSVAAA